MHVPAVIQNNIRMSSKLISHPSLLYHFVRGQYLHDTRKQVESLYLKLRDLYSNATKRTVDAWAKERSWRYCATVLLSLIDQMKNDESPHCCQNVIPKMEADAKLIHGCICSRWRWLLLLRNLASKCSKSIISAYNMQWVFSLQRVQHIAIAKKSMCTKV